MDWAFLTAQTVLWGLLAVVALVYGIIAIVGTLSVWSISSGKLERLSDAEADDIYTVIADVVDPAWAEGEGFEKVGCYQLRTVMMSPRVAAWRHGGGSVFMCVYLMEGGQTSMDFVTEFSEDVGLTTGTTADAQLFPQRAGHYTQSFSGRDPEELWKLHLQAERDITTHDHIQPPDTARGFAEAILSGMAGQMAHVRSLRLWPLRIPWWFMRRHRNHNKTLAERMRW